MNGSTLIGFVVGASMIFVCPNASSAQSSTEYRYRVDVGYDSVGGGGVTGYHVFMNFSGNISGIESFSGLKYYCSPSEGHITCRARPRKWPDDLPGPRPGFGPRLSVPPDLLHLDYRFYSPTGLREVAIEEVYTEGNGEIFAPDFSVSPTEREMLRVIFRLPDE